jgi:hypothetical protein
MKRRLFFGIVLLFIFILTACTASSSVQLIEPGDKVGDFTITTATDGNFTYGFAIQCVGPGQANAYTCDATVGQAINVSTGLRGTSGNGNLDAVWKNADYKLYINDLPVDLAVFATIEYNHPPLVCSVLPMWSSPPISPDLSRCAILGFSPMATRFHRLPRISLLNLDDLKPGFACHYFLFFLLKNRISEEIWSANSPTLVCLSVISKFVSASTGMSWA